VAMAPRIGIVEFPTDDPERARRFWSEVLGIVFEERTAEEGWGWQTRTGDAELGLHERGPGPGDRFSLPYLSVPELSDASSGSERTAVRSSTRVNGGRSAATPKGARSA
jgi:catechol 2,3-dioxygenase-like lactoylglutathione lyase family enzyme